MAVNATAVWRVRPSGSNTNGGGYDPGISGAATDYSQQNSAQASGTHLTGTSATVTDSTASAFTNLMIGNAMYITGGGATAGWYFVTAFTSSSVVVLDRSPGSITNATWHLGGGWADFWTNLDSSGSFTPAGTVPVVPGNTIFILGSGTPNPSSYTYDYTLSTLFTPPSGNTSAGFITFANDPSTPGYLAPPNTTGGMPTIKIPGLSFYSVEYISLEGLFLVLSGTLDATVYGIILSAATATPNSLFGCVLDQFGHDCGISCGSNSTGVINLVGCEAFSSVAPGSPGAQPIIGQTGSGFYSTVIGSNIHDTVGPGLSSSGSSNFGFVVTDCIIAKCRGDGISISTASGLSMSVIKNNTIDSNLGNGITCGDHTALSTIVLVNNIISNHIQAGKFGLSVGSGGASANTKIAILADYNVYYNNTANYNAINAGPHDTALGSNPYVGQSTEDYTLA